MTATRRIRQANGEYCRRCLGNDWFRTTPLLSSTTVRLRVLPSWEDEVPVSNPVGIGVSRYLERGGDPFKLIKAADLVARRNPDDVEAWMTLAAVVGLPGSRSSRSQAPQT